MLYSRFIELIDQNFSLGAVALSVACPLRMQGISDNDPCVMHILLPFPLIHKEPVVSYRGKNVHLILANCLREYCLRATWLKIDWLDNTLLLTGPLNLNKTTTTKIFNVNYVIYR